jgi:hypothetical protein
LPRARENPERKRKTAIKIARHRRKRRFSAAECSFDKTGQRFVLRKERRTSAQIKQKERRGDFHDFELISRASFRLIFIEMKIGTWSRKSSHLRATENELKVSLLKQGKNKLQAQLERFVQARNRSHQIGRVPDEYRAAVRARN